MFLGCWSSGSSDPAHPPELAPGRAIAALGVVLHVACSDPLDEASRELLCPVDLTPERLLVEVVVAREARNAVLLCLRSQQPAGVALAGERPVDPAERLDADEVAKHEHVERDLQLQLGLDLRRRMSGLARLVVLNDPACTERVEIDAVDLSGEREGAEIESSLELLRRALRAERNLEAARDQLQLRGGLVPQERLQVAQQALLELTPLQVGQLHPNPSHRLAETLAHEAKRIVELVRPELLDAEPLGDAREELVQRAMGDLAAQAGIDDLVDRARADQPADEPDRTASGTRLQLGDAEVRLLA